MRIALTITELDPGGAEKCLVQLAIYLQRRGHEVCVFALGPTPQDSLGKTANRAWMTDLLDQHQIPWKTGNARGLGSFLRVVQWLRNELNSVSPDVIQSMLFHANVVTALANRKLNCPHFGGARVSQPSRWRRVLQRWATNRMVKLVCVSQAVAEKCVQEEGISASRISVIPNGVSLENLSSLASAAGVAELDNVATRDIPADVPLLVFVGRLSSQKGILPLVQQVDRLLEKLPEHHWVILGDGPERSSLETAITQSKSANRVHLLGWRSDAMYWINRSQLLLLPSLYEGMPNVVLEAMGLGKPVVTFAVEGIDDLLPNEPLQVVQGREVDRFVTQVNLLAADAELCGQLGAKNRQRIEQYFRLEDQMAKYEQLYLQHMKATQGIER